MTDHLIGPDLEFHSHLSEGRFMIQRSRSSGRYVFVPRIAEPATGQNDLEWVEASGRGIVHASTVVRVRPPAAHYNVALVDLDEGPRMMSRVDGIAPDEVRAGLAVRAEIVTEEGRPLVIFRPA